MKQNNVIKVSVIIPMYNVEVYIAQTLQSALAQALREIEIICVDDGSSDRTIEIVRDTAGEDPRVKIIGKSNGGASSARNVGIEAAQGEYIYFLDSDDYLDPGTLQILYEEVSKYCLDNIFFDAETFFDSPELEQQLSFYKGYYSRSRDYSSIMTGPEMYVAMEMNYDFKPSPCLQLIKKSVLTEHNIRFYEGIVMEDNLFSLQVILSCEKVKHLAEAFYKRRIRADSVMTNAGFFHAYSYYVCIKEIMNYARNKEYTESIYKALAHRCRAMQKSAADKLESLSVTEIEKGIAELPANQRLEFPVMISNLLRERQMVRQKADRVKNSRSYRIGECVLWLPRKIKKLLK